MKGQYYTATFEVRNAGTRGDYSKLKRMVLLDGIHPAMFLAAYPDMKMEPGKLLHSVTLAQDEHEALCAAYHAMGNGNDVYTFARVHEEVEQEVRKSYEERFSLDALMKLDGLLAYAKAAGIVVPSRKTAAA